MAPCGTERRAERMGSHGAVRVALLVALSAVLLVPETAPATVAEQRQRLPPAAFCQDDVAGVWRSHYYFARQAEWYIFTLEIKRVEGNEDALEGTIRSHFWNGRSDVPEPPPCRAGLFRQIVKMPAKGQIRDGIVTFGGTSWELETSVCGSRRVSYNADSFSGKIDPEIQEFQSVNNDRGAAVNVPVVFRRVKCPDLPEEPEPIAIDVKPPAFQPPARKPSGCNCNWP